MKFETHCHTKENDRVVEMPADKIVEAYHGIGYDGMVITNHYFDIYFEWYKDLFDVKNHKQVIDCYLNGYRKAKAKGEELGMTILLGIELRFDGTINDYLVYGLTEEFLYESPYLNTLDLDSFLKIMPSNALMYHAHPFRNKMTVTSPEYFYGVEVYNGGTKPDRNEFADLWADKYDLHKISGTDFHHIEQLGRGGIVLNNKISTQDEFVNALRNDEYKLIKNGIVVEK